MNVPHVVCNSGGRTSAYMTEQLLKVGLKPVIAFANTGWEHPLTLKFVEQCHDRWMELYGVGVTLLEPVVYHGEKTASTHKVMTFDTLSRKCEPFIEVVKKYGIANVAYMHCTRELKENPVISYMQSLGGVTGHVKNKKGVSANYETFIGIRADEPKRLTGIRDGRQKKVYPLADWAPFRVDELDILDFWEDMPFNLEIEKHEGNCLGCFKKSTARLMAVMETVGEDAFDFAKYIDENYGFVGDNVIGGVKSDLPRTMYRNYVTPDKLIQMFRNTEKRPTSKDEEVIGCGDDCQPFMGGNEMEIIQDPQIDMFTEEE